MIFHDQENSIEEAVHQLDDAYRNLNLVNHCVHTGPLIRREEDYQHMDIKERQRILNVIVMRVYFECSYKELSQVLGISENTAKVRYHRGIEILKGKIL